MRAIAAEVRGDRGIVSRMIHGGGDRGPAGYASLIENLSADSPSFHLEPASDAVALDCNGTPAELPASLFDFQVGSTCPFGDTTRVYHSDIDHLTGTWSCAGTDLTASWDFVAPDAGFGP